MLYYADGKMTVKCKYGWMTSVLLKLNIFHLKTSVNIYNSSHTYNVQMMSCQIFTLKIFRENKM